MGWMVFAKYKGDVLVLWLLASSHDDAIDKTVDRIMEVFAIDYDEYSQVVVDPRLVPCITRNEIHHVGRFKEL